MTIIVWAEEKEAERKWVMEGGALPVDERPTHAHC